MKATITFTKSPPFLMLQNHRTLLKNRILLAQADERPHFLVKWGTAKSKARTREVGFNREEK